MKKNSLYFTFRNCSNQPISFSRHTRRSNERNQICRLKKHEKPIPPILNTQLKPFTPNKCDIDEDDGDKCKSNAYLFAGKIASTHYAICAMNTLYSLTKRGLLIVKLHWLELANGPMGEEEWAKRRWKIDAYNVVLFIKIG